MSSAALIEQIKDDLGYLKLHRSSEVFAALAEEAKREGRSALEFLAAVLAEETAATRQRRLNARLRFAHFPARRTLEDFDFSFQPSIDPNLIADLAGLDFVEAGTPVLFLGKPGCGKSHLAIALGIRAVEAGYRGYFTTATDMVAAMTTAYADGTFTTKMRTYTGPSVLVIDDVGITPFDRNQSNAFFQVVNRRYENRSATVVTTNRGLPAWAELFGGDSVVAAAILDRLLDRAAVINIKGPSWRLREHQALTQPLSQLNDPPERPPRRRG
ncbi:MAG: IS21-like element helper ATPase IstB [Actinomycetota bacterium]|jgi:DNA replication protein DnaC|nr:IS21-like element helper ATPase IstB [Actinomycetota bacterium]